MRCIPQEEPYRTVYFIFLLMVHSMILRHDFLACITAYNTRRLAFCSNVQNHLYDVTGCLGQIELMYSLQDSLPACFSLPWLFIMIQITSIVMYHCPSLACFSSKHITCSTSPGSPSFFCDDRPLCDRTRVLPCGGGRCHRFPAPVVNPYIIAGNNSRHDSPLSFKFVDHVDSLGQAAYPIAHNFFHTNIPLCDVVPYLSV